MILANTTDSNYLGQRYQSIFLLMYMSDRQEEGRRKPHPSLYAAVSTHSVLEQKKLAPKPSSSHL